VLEEPLQHRLVPLPAQEAEELPLRLKPLED
jgi:hypothetical protein